MIEGPGHIPINGISNKCYDPEENVFQCSFLYMLGPIVCDVAPGYDHICVSAIGAASFLQKQEQISSVM